MNQALLSQNSNIPEHDSLLAGGHLLSSGEVASVGPRDVPCMVRKSCGRGHEANLKIFAS